MGEVIFDNVPEDVLHAIVQYWHFKEGDHVEEGEDLVELKTNDNKAFTISTPVSGILIERLFTEEDEVEIGEILAQIQEEDETHDDELDLNDDEDELTEQEETDDEPESMDEESEY